MRHLLVLLGVLWSFALPAHAVPVGWMTTLSGGCSTATTVVAITSGVTYTVPANYCSLVEVDVIGEGGAGSAGAPGNGGGGAWANLTGATYTPGQSITIQIGSGGSGTDTCWVSCATLKAQRGLSAVGSTAGSGGAAASSVGTNKFSGGNGGGVLNGGGGGAGGPNGAGVAGVANTGGGAGDNGLGGAGGAFSAGGTPSAGGAGTEYALTAGGSAGSGGGGGYAGNGVTQGATGGLYGGGAGACNGCATPRAGVGGLIIFQYHSR